MDTNVLKGKWKQFRGGAKSKWGELTDDDLDQIDGDRIKLEGKLQEKYGRTKEQASREVDEWMSQQKETV
jgi:uncharacterized protein YjbJ (UPF0337 family)